MPLPPSLQTAPHTGSAWDEIEGLIREVAEQARTDLAPAEFHAALLDRAVRGLAAVGGAVWVPSSGRPSVDCQVRLAEVLPGDEADQEQHQRLVASAFERADVRLVPPASADADGAGNRTSYSVLLGPVLVADRAAAVIELFQRPGASPAAQQGYVQFLAALCELAAEYQRNRELRSLRDQSEVWGRFENFSERLHATLNVQNVAYAVVNEGRQVIPCDRLSIAVRRGRSCRLEAVSGLDTLDRRANSVRHLERLADAVAGMGDPLWYEGNPVGLPPQIETALEAYLPESRVRMVGVVPLIATTTASGSERAASQVLGALIVERFDQSRADDSLRTRVQAVCRQVVPALRNALEVDAVPLYSAWRRMGLLTSWWRGGRLLKAMIIAALIAAAVVALCVIPADFNVESFGELQPETRRDVFAPSDGIVSELKVQPAQLVAAGDVLAVLQSSKLDYEFSRVLGEKQTAQQRLATIKSARLQPGSDTEVHKLAAEQSELEVQLKSLEEQQDILQRQRDELSVKSPIVGRVLNFDPSRELASRPVQRGDLLLTVADVDQAWHVEMQVPDHAIGHVLAAQREKGHALPVTFLLASDPGVTYYGTVEKVASNAEIHETEGPCVKVTVRVTDPVRTAFRPGARVIPKIACGKRPIGYVWLHDLIDAVRTRVLF